MSSFLLVRNIKSSVGDVSPTDFEPQENVDYTLLVDVSLAEVREKKSTGEETPDKTYIFMPTGTLRFIKPHGETPGIQN